MNDNYPVILAKESVDNFVRHGILQNPLDPPEDFNDQKAAFVTIKVFGKLRGCIGTIIPVKNTLAEEIAANAISAATRDPRFRPVIESELDYLTYSVDVLSKSFRVDDVDILDHSKYGVIVKKGMRQGVLLPDIEGVNSVDDQLRIAAQKAGISLAEKPEVWAFEVVRFGKK